MFDSIDDLFGFLLLLFVINQLLKKKQHVDVWLKFKRYFVFGCRMPPYQCFMEDITLYDANNRQSSYRPVKVKLDVKGIYIAYIMVIGVVHRPIQIPWSDVNVIRYVKRAGRKHLELILTNNLRIQIISNKSLEKKIAFIENNNIWPASKGQPE